MALEIHRCSGCGSDHLVIGLIRERPGHAVAIGIHRDCGAGKSSTLEMIEANLAADDKVLCIKFNGWRFQGFEDAKIALAEGIVTGLIEKRPFSPRPATRSKTSSSGSIR